MKIKILFIALIIVLTACSSDDASYQTISPDLAYERLQEEDILLVDVRTESEYTSGAIVDSILFPLDTLEDDFEDQYPDKDQTIFVYCRSGNRSQTAANILLDLGYKNVFDLGGIIDWPYEIE